MANLDFEVSNTLVRDETKVTDAGKQKIRVLKFTTVGDKGIVVHLTVQGAVDVMDATFLTFPIGAQGIPYKLTLETNQTTTANQVKQALQADADASKGQDGTSLLDFDALDKDLKAIANEEPIKLEQKANEIASKVTGETPKPTKSK